MAKKYVPSGYQIIHLDIDGNGDLVINEDSKLLETLLKNGSEKPILCKIHDESEGSNIIKIGDLINNILLVIINLKGSFAEYRFEIDNDSLKFTFNTYAI